MEKRLFLAIALSILVLMAYSSIAPRPIPIKPQEAGGLDEVSPVPSLTPSSYNEQKVEIIPEKKELIIADLDSSKESLKIAQNDDLSLSIDPRRGAGIKECKIKSYDIVLPQTNIGLLAEWQGAEFKTEDITSGIASSYVDLDKGLEIRKEYRFTEDRYIIEMVLEFITLSKVNSYVKYSLNICSMSEEVFKKNPMDQRYIEFSISLPDKTLRNNFLRFDPNVVNNKIQWLGIRDRYFCVIVRPLQDSEQLIKSQDAGLTSYLLQVPSFELLPGQKITHKYLIYLGPQKQEFIKNIGAKAEEIVYFGVFDSLSQILLGALNILYRVSKNWGIAIILFSLVVFLIMSPLSIKSFSSMKRMQELQPVIEELRVKYKDNPQKMHKEVMVLYREKRINPLGGCLPLVLQMPIFIALYQTLMRFIDLKGAQFLWIKDLSEPDRLMVFPKTFPVIGSELNLLPIIMIITMLIQQKLTGGKSQQGGASVQQQKMMSLFMAVFFGIIFYHMPSGLVLYWAVNSLLMLVFQIKMFGKTTTSLVK